MDFAATSKFFDLLADLLTAGFSLKQALQSLKVFLPKNRLATVIAELETGQSFSQALRSKVTTNIYCQLVIAEKHGSVDQSVFQLGKYLKNVCSNVKSYSHYCYIQRSF